MEIAPFLVQEVCTTTTQHQWETSEVVLGKPYFEEAPLIQSVNGDHEIYLMSVEFGVEVVCPKEKWVGDWLWEKEAVVFAETLRMSG